jgi:hypothetical protein
LDALAAEPIEGYVITSLVSTLVTSTFIEVFCAALAKPEVTVLADEFKSTNLKIYLPSPPLKGGGRFTLFKINKMLYIPFVYI